MIYLQRMLNRMLFQLNEMFGDDDFYHRCHFAAMHDAAQNRERNKMSFD